MSRDDTHMRDDRDKGDATNANQHEEVNTTAEEHADAKAKETKGKGDKASSNAYDKAFKAMFHRNPQPAARNPFGEGGIRARLSSGCAF